ncbi:MAG: SRPBCC family protein [Pseudomonadota bacterium]
MPLYDTRTVTLSIAAPWQAVYDFMREPANLPQWASGLASGIREEGGRWLAESPMGTVEVRMAPRNGFGVLDHDVVLPSGQVVYNALRVMPNRDGCAVAFTVFRTDGLDAAAFAADVAHVEKDLRALKALVERG